MHVCARDITLDHNVVKSLQTSQGNILFVRALTVSHTDWVKSKIVLGWQANARELKVCSFSTLLTSHAKLYAHFILDLPMRRSYLIATTIV